MCSCARVSDPGDQLARADVRLFCILRVGGGCEMVGAGSQNHGNRTFLCR